MSPVDSPSNAIPPAHRPLVPIRSSLAAQCAEIIRVGLQEGRWSNFLPAERRLSEELQVGRLTLRKALKQLVQEGRLQVAHGKPTKIVRTKKFRSRAGPLSVGFVTPKPLSHLRPFVTLWIDDLRSQLQAAGCVLHIHEGERYYQQDPAVALSDLVHRHRHAAWVLYLTNRRIQQWVAKVRLPVVVAGYTYPDLDLPFVVNNHHLVCRHAAHRMLALGHRHIVFLKPRSYGPGDQLGERAFLEAFSSGRGAEAKPSIKIPPENTEGLVKFIDRLLHGPEAPTAILIARTSWFFTIFSYLQSKGVRIPGQISLVARDDETFLDALYPAATRYSFSGRVFARKMAQAALSVVHDEIVGREFSVTPHLVPGGTLGPAPGFTPAKL